MSYISTKEKKIDEIVSKLFGDTSTGLACIVKADLMSKEDGISEDEIVNKNKELIEIIKKDNKDFTASVGHLELTYGVGGVVVAVAHIEEQSEN